MEINLTLNEVNYVRASTWKRLFNYIIDLIFFGILYSLVLGIIFRCFPDFGASYSIFEEDRGNVFLLNFFYLLSYATTMGLVEGIFRGRTIGKWFTKTKAFNLDGSEISFGKAMSRAFCRIVPFCVFSAFGHPCNPWQDRWTNTMVADLKASQLDSTPFKNVFED
ncbi:RDD family protein [Rhizosphaericola mali]|uniref:RDD family protein n=1 Tax=Rhizosphaericola mali TaxID=2545455 RepID=A0A5P2G0J6_9BACT|nr:RDD family protein [Rhizosphaericola mali]QES89326.1 RDD family protein [Rhizosphaericola mali]